MITKKKIFEIFFFLDLKISSNQTKEVLKMCFITLFSEIQKPRRFKVPIHKENHESLRKVQIFKNCVRQENLKFAPKKPRKELLVNFLKSMALI